MKIIILLSIIFLLSFKSYAQSSALDYSIQLSAGYGIIRDHPSYNVAVTLYTMQNINFIPTVRYAHYNESNAVYVGFTNYDKNTLKNAASLNLNAGMFFTDEPIQNYSFNFSDVFYGIYVYATMSYYIYNNISVSFDAGITGMETINYSFLINLNLKL